jgi:hypothetical protein
MSQAQTSERGAPTVLAPPDGGTVNCGSIPLSILTDPADAVVCVRLFDAENPGGKPFDAIHLQAKDTSAVHHWRVQNPPPAGTVCELRVCYADTSCADVHEDQCKTVTIKCG